MLGKLIKHVVLAGFILTVGLVAMELQAHRRGVEMTSPAVDGRPAGVEFQVQGEKPQDAADGRPIGVEFQIAGRSPS